MTEPQHQHQQMDVVKPNDDHSESNLQALIEKVVNEEIKKLASTTEVIKLVSVSLLNSESASTEAVTEGLMTTEGEPEATSGSSNLDRETVLPTIVVPAIEIEPIKAETMSSDTTTSLPNEQNRIKVSEEMKTTTNRLQPDEIVIGENRISDSLLSAVSDLLSSILGLESSLLKTKPDGSFPVDESIEKMQTVSNRNKIEEDNSVSKKTVATSTKAASQPLATTIPFEMEASSDAPEIEQGTEKLDGTTPEGYEGEQSYEEELGEMKIVPLKFSSTALNAFKDKTVSEIDLKIENLANSQTSLTESTPEQQVTETVRDENVNVLEVISESDKAFQPVSFDDSVNQVMNLVKAAEKQPSFGSMLNEKNMKEDVILVDEVVYGTLKEIETTLGIHHRESQKDELKAEDAPSSESVEEEMYLKEKQESLTRNELMKELDEKKQKDSFLAHQEALKIYEIPENNFMKEFEQDLKMHQTMPQESEKRGDLIKSLLSELNESLLKEHPVDYFVPNSAKAALQYKQADVDEDF